MYPVVLYSDTSVYFLYLKADFGVEKPVYATYCWGFFKGIQLLSMLFNWVFHLVHSIQLSFPSIKEFVNGLCFSPTHFHGIDLQQRSFYTDGKFPALAFRLLTMKNTDIYSLNIM